MQIYQLFSSNSTKFKGIGGILSFYLKTDYSNEFSIRKVASLFSNWLLETSAVYAVESNAFSIITDVKPADILGFKHI